MNWKSGTSMGTDDAYPFGTLLCRVNYRDRHIPCIYLGLIPYSYFEASSGTFKTVVGGSPVDVIIDTTDEYGPRLGWDTRTTIETRYHPWNADTCKP
jgi:hypothetical protein